MKIDLTNLENEIKDIARNIVNEAGQFASVAATRYVRNTYNTRVDTDSIKTTLATTSDLTFKIAVRGRSVSLVKKVVRVTNRGVSVLVKKSPKFIQGAFISSWQKNQTTRWLFLRRGSLRRALYTIGLVGMFKSRGTMNAINNSINKTLRKFK